MVIPHWNPRELLMRKKKIQISAMLSNPSAVIIEREEGAFRIRGSRIGSQLALSGLIDIVTKMDLEASITSP